MTWSFCEETFPTLEVFAKLLHRSLASSAASKLLINDGLVEEIHDRNVPNIVKMAMYLTRLPYLSFRMIK